MTDNLLSHLSLVIKLLKSWSRQQEYPEYLLCHTCDPSNESHPEETTTHTKLSIFPTQCIFAPIYSSQYWNLTFIILNQAFDPCESTYAYRSIKLPNYPHIYTSYIYSVLSLTALSSRTSHTHTHTHIVWSTIDYRHTHTYIVRWKLCNTKYTIDYRRPGTLIQWKRIPSNWNSCALHPISHLGNQ